MKRIVFTILLLAWTAAAAHAETKFIKPEQKDKCPVCGMFVAKYPDFIAEIVYKDNSYVVFDGTKDMFKYYFDIQKYSPSKSPADIGSIFVTDYYSLSRIDGYKAYYVLGSDVYGPMGRELIPFAQMKDAEEFRTDHKGKKILRFNEITRAIHRAVHQPRGPSGAFLGSLCVLLRRGPGRHTGTRRYPIDCRQARPDGPLHLHRRPVHPPSLHGRPEHRFPGLSFVVRALPLRIARPSASSSHDG
jgi:nitrous oxide reductase accessory protein NosL